MYVISLEYIIAQFQVGKTSYAIKSHINRNQNPGLIISKNKGKYFWEFTGLSSGDIETVSGQARANHIDIYVTQNQLRQQMPLFPFEPLTPGVVSTAPKNPTRSVRAGGKRIPWGGPVDRIKAAEILAVIPPYKLLTNPSGELFLNIDREYARYPLPDGTRKEIHFGVEHDFIWRKKKTLKIPRITITLTKGQYAKIWFVLQTLI